MQQSKQQEIVLTPTQTNLITRTLRSLTFALALLTPASIATTPPPRSTVHLAVGSMPGNIVYLQIDLARALHYFEDAGINIRIDSLRKGADAAGDLLHRRVDFSANSIDHVITLGADGGNLKMVASFTDLPTVTLVVRRDLRSQIRTIADLKGRRIGVTSFGSGTHVLLASILKKNGFSLKDVTVTSVGAGDSLIAAMKQKQIDAALATDPTTIRLLLDGDASLLLDMVTFEETQRVFNGSYQFTGLLTRQDVIEHNPALVQKMVAVVVRANHYIATHSAAEIAAALPPDIVGDRYIYIKSLEHSRPAISRDGLVTPESIANNVQSLITFGSIQGNHPINPATFYDMSFVKQAQTH
jgi:NitT/TauT family transport system substrate-binding protein